MMLLEFFRKYRQAFNIAGLESMLELPDRCIDAWIRGESTLASRNFEKLEAWINSIPDLTKPEPRKITMTDKEARDRAKMITEYQNGAGAKDLAQKYGYEKSTVYKYIREYNTDGIAAINVARRLRKEKAPADAIKNAIENCTDVRKKTMLEALLKVSKKEISLNEAAQKCGVSPQYLLKIRRSI